MTHFFLRAAGYEENELTGVILRSIKVRNGWRTWSAKVPETMERVGESFASQRSLRCRGTDIPRASLPNGPAIQEVSTIWT